MMSMVDPYVARAKKYAKAVTAGKIIAGKYVILACQRFLDDLQRKDLTLYPTKGKKSPGSKWCSFLERLVHVKGKWAGKKFVMSDWQVFCTVNMYGWHWVKSGKRRFREAVVIVSRKNGKTFWFAGLGLGHLLIDGEIGGEVYCGASSKDQAFEIFKPARLMCLNTPELAKHYGIEINKQSLNVPSNGSLFHPVIGKPGDGASPSASVVDEYHEHPDDDQYDTFQTGMGARENPMMLVISTAGFDMSSPCYDKQLEVQAILKGSIDDDSMFGIIYCADESDEWDTIDALKKANPNYGVSVFEDYLKGQLKTARRSPRKQVTFKTKHLCLWVGAKKAWMNMLAYQACKKKKQRLSQFKGREVIVGDDLATKTDIASQGVLVLPSEDDPKYHYFCFHYLPEETVLNGGNTRYKEWHENGWLTATPGNVTDYGYIEDDLKDIAKEFNLKEAAFDPYQATQFSTRMIEKGLPMVEVGQTWKNLSEPMKEAEAMILGKEIEFNEDPVLNWMMGNTVAILGRTDDIFPSKENPKTKLMALFR